MHARAAIPALGRVAASSAVTRHCALGRARRAPLSHASRFSSFFPWWRSVEEQVAVTKKVEAEADAARAGAEATRSKTAAESKKADAEAEATRIKAVAESKKADAEAEATRIKAVAESKKADAESKKADAESKKAVAESKKADAEAEATHIKAAAEVKEKERRWRRFLALTAVGAAGTLALGIDWVLHDSRTYLKWRVKCAMQSGELVEGGAPPLALTLQLDRPPRLVQGTVRPTLLFGPSGCGKSTYVQRVAFEYANSSPRKPAALVKFRLPQDSRMPADSSAPGGSGSMPVDDGAVLAERVAASVCKQLHIPLRSSLLSSITSVKFGTSSTVTVEASVAMKMNQARGRLARAQFAISILFEAAEEVSKDTRVRPLLIFDEAHDLVRNPTLSKLGGRDLFNQLGTAAVWYGIEKETIHFVGVGSSSLFISYWAETTPLAGARVVVQEMPDPSRERLVEALTTKRENGVAYSTEDANKLLDACGQRLRLVDAALRTEDAAAQPVAEMIACVYRSAEASVDELFCSLDSAGHAKLVKVLDAIVAADADATRTRPSLSDLPFKLRVTDMPPAALRVLYVDDAAKLRFQSDAVRAVWLSKRRGPSTPL